MRQSAALAGSLLLNLLLLAGVVAAMRGPDALAPGVRSALVTVSIVPAPRKTTPPPPAPSKRPGGKQTLTPPAPAAVAASRAPVVLPAKSGPPAAPPAPAQAKTQATLSAPPVPRPEPRQAEPPEGQIDAYRQELWQRILAARPRGGTGTGTVTIRFRVDRSGGLVSAEVTGSSGQFMLDRMALQAVRKAAPFPAPPAAMDDAALAFTVPMAFHR